MTSSSTKKKRSLILPITAAIIAIAVIGFIASRAGLDKALVKQKLDDFIAAIEEKSRAQGRDLTITYGELEVVGSFASKHVVVHNPSLTMKPLAQNAQPNNKAASDALTITTPNIEIYPLAQDLSAARITFPAPIDFAEVGAPQKSLLKINSNVPPVFVVAQTTGKDGTYNEISYQSPTEIELVYLREQQAKGEEEKTPEIVPVYETLSLSIAQGSGVTTRFAADKSGLGTAKIFFRDLVLTPKVAPEGAVKLAEITGEWSNALNEKKLNAVHAQLKAGPVTSDNTNAPYLPILLDFDATYEGMMGKSPESIAQVGTQESAMVLKKLSLTSKDASITAAGNFTATPADMLPVGTANVALSNAPFVLGELRKFNIVNAQNETLIYAVLQQVTGKPVEQLTDVAIPIERIRGGAFKIGNSTFEELFALVLKQALKPVTPATPAPSSSLVPQLPPADKPKLAPIELNDLSVRG